MLFLYGQNDSILPISLTKHTEIDRFYLHLLLSKTAKKHRLPAVTSYLVEEKHCFFHPKTLLSCIKK